MICETKRFFWWLLIRYLESRTENENSSMNLLVLKNYDISLSYANVTNHRCQIASCLFAKQQYLNIHSEPHSEIVAALKTVGRGSIETFERTEN